VPRWLCVSSTLIIPDMMPHSTHWGQPAELGANFTNWPGSANPSTVVSFKQHDITSSRMEISHLGARRSVCKYYSTEKVTGRWNTVLFHRYFFSRDSKYFSTKFSQLDVRDHEHLTTIIHWVMLSARILKPFFLSYIPSKLQIPFALSPSFTHLVPPKEV